MNHLQLCHVLGSITIIAPALLVLLLGIPTLLSRPIAERWVSVFVQMMTSLGLAASVAVLGVMLWAGETHVTLSFGGWVHIPHYHFSFKFMFDRLSLPFLILTFVMCGTISAFANSYMHREPGFNRFFVLYAFFVLGMVISTLAGTIETLFTGWELVGLSSALLVAFYHNRTGPVRNGLHVWTIYRVSDAAFLIASVIMHHLTGGGDFDKMLGLGGWPVGQAHLTPDQALWLGLLLLLTAAGKSALVPFSGWLPRAMEGPTPSSAVFYGALSVHLGAYLLLRVSPILDLSPTLSAAVVTIGLLTAMFAAYTGRVQTDIKSALSFASLTQVGLIVAEIGLGLRYLALIHILGHASLRMFQFLRAPSLLYDYRTIENAIGEHLPRSRTAWLRRIPPATLVRMYRLALERGYLDVVLKDYIARPVLALFSWCNQREQQWTHWIAGTKATDSETAPEFPFEQRLEELL